MARVALSDEEIQALRRRAAHAATRLFAERGYDAFTMRSLAGELGCSPMTPYRYLENKEELFALVRTEAYRRFADRQKEAYEGETEADNAPLPRLLRLKRAYIQFAIDEPDAYRTMFELRQGSPERYTELSEQSVRGFSYVRRAVEEAVEDGLLSGEPLTVAHLLWANTHGLVSLHLAGKLQMGRSLQQLVAADSWTSQ